MKENLQEQNTCLFYTILAVPVGNQVGVTVLKPVWKARNHSRKEKRFSSFYFQTQVDFFINHRCC